VTEVDLERVLVYLRVTKDIGHLYCNYHAQRIDIVEDLAENVEVVVENEEIVVVVAIENEVVHVDVDLEEGVVVYLRVT